MSNIIDKRRAEILFVLFIISSTNYCFEKRMVLFTKWFKCLGYEKF